MEVVALPKEHVIKKKKKGISILDAWINAHLL
jgi:hypothetical protein